MEKTFLNFASRAEVDSIGALGEGSTRLNDLINEPSSNINFQTIRLLGSLLVWKLMLVWGWEKEPKLNSNF